MSVPDPESCGGPGQLSPVLPVRPDQGRPGQVLRGHDVQHRHHGLRLAQQGHADQAGVQGPGQARSGQIPLLQAKVELN